MPFEGIRPMVSWECPINLREASGLDPEAVHWVLGQDDAPPKSDDSAMETLQRRYARGEIDEEEFQQRCERLMKNQEN
ncbi:SHOCT domain-containing protein [Halomicrococcus sp. NG-SE-24]|uniref:SHOCT domain-containing protein n=1 Tax=Halomicrococcus sp. NG-SE-24 TaxID=3436928 RepID=UPI003D9550E9